MWKTDKRFKILMVWKIIKHFEIFSSVKKLLKKLEKLFKIVKPFGEIVKKKKPQD